MERRGSVFVALLLIMAGLFILAVNLADLFLRLSWGRLWPGFIALAGLAFFLPIGVWWEHRRTLAGLAIPGTILLVNAAIFFYNVLGGGWACWAYLWALEPVAVGLGLYAACLVGPYHHGLVMGGNVLVTIGLLCFAAFGVAFGSDVTRAVASFVLIGLGIVLLVRSLTARRSPKLPTKPGIAA